MEKYLLLGFALMLSSAFTAAGAECVPPAVVHGSDSSSVVQGNTVEIETVVPANSTGIIYLDGKQTLISVNSNSTPLPVVTTLPLASYGKHTLQANWKTCAQDFSNVPASPVPGTPVLSASPTLVESNSPYTLSWSVPAGMINHYTLSRNVSGNDNTTTSVISASVTAETLRSMVPSGLDRDFIYAIRACSTSDDSICSSWSNSVDIDVFAPCIGRCQ